MNIVAIIPVYNEEANIQRIVRGTQKYVETVLVVDDGSTDKTVHHAEQAGAVVIRHPHNLGKGAACRSGFYAAVKLKCDGIIMLDGDGQHDPDEIPSLLKAREQSHGKPGIVLGNRMSDVKKMPFLRLQTNRLLSLLISFLARQKVHDSQCGFRYLDRDILEKVNYENNRYDAESEILVRASRRGFAIYEVPIRTIYGNEYSKINIFWDTLRFIRFFFRHLFHSPPVSVSEAHRISIKLGSNVELPKQSVDVG